MEALTLVFLAPTQLAEICIKNMFGRTGKMVNSALKAKEVLMLHSGANRMTCGSEVSNLCVQFEVASSQLREV